MSIHETGSFGESWDGRPLFGHPCDSLTPATPNASPDDAIGAANDSAPLTDEEAACNTSPQSDSSHSSPSSLYGPMVSGAGGEALTDEAVQEAIEDADALVCAAQSYSRKNMTIPTRIADILTTALRQAQELEAALRQAQEREAKLREAGNALEEAVMGDASYRKMVALNWRIVESGAVVVFGGER